MRDSKPGVKDNKATDAGRGTEVNVWCADLLIDRLGVNLPDERDYSTVAGFALSVLKHLPETGEKFRHDGWSFEVVDMDGRKIDKLLVSRAKPKQRRGETEAAASR